MNPKSPPTSTIDPADLHARLRTRRSTRAFSKRPVSRETIEHLVRCATTAPSGANKQPWRFVCVADLAVKRRIRLAAEAEEREFYDTRISDRWRDDLAPLGTTADKPYLETAPWLVIVFKLVRGDDGSQIYYPDESVGIAVGVFLAAAHLAGLATLTHTPSPMRFLRDVLGRPDNERPFVLIPVGHAAEDWHPPEHAATRKPLGEVMVTLD